MYTKKKGLAALIAAVTGLSSLAVGTVSAAPAAAENEEAVKIPTHLLTTDNPFPMTITTPDTAVMPFRK